MNSSRAFLSLMIRTEMALETAVSYRHLTGLIAREDFIEFFIYPSVHALSLSVTETVCLSVLRYSCKSLQVCLARQCADLHPSLIAEVKECVELYLHSPIRLQVVVLN
jgi:hypothetical protein